MKVESLIKRNEELFCSEMDEELVMMNLESNNYFGLNKIGRDIWERLEKPKTIEVLCQELTQKYDVSTKQCQKDVSTFLEKLQETNLIEIV